MLSMVRHKNIVQFYGVCSAAPDYCIVTEYASNGSLSAFLSNPVNASLQFANILQWADDIAQGLKYLHCDALSDGPILHRDLKSKNVVINEDWICKLCDFGASKTTRNSMTTHKSVAGTVPWMSP
jgi:sterile alpha motif and leucine zipper-containing kinase AZK